MARVFLHRETVRFRDLPYTGEMTMILARAEVDFRSPLGFGEEVEIAVRPARLGRKSFDLAYELRSADRVVAEARTVLVTYDYEKSAPIEIPSEWRDRLAA